VAGLGDCRIPLHGSQNRHTWHTFSLNNSRIGSIFVINELIGRRVDIKIDGDNYVGFSFADQFGNFLLFVDNGFTGTESGTAVIELEAPDFIDVFEFDDTRGSFTISSDQLYRRRSTLIQTTRGK